MDSVKIFKYIITINLAIVVLLVIFLLGAKYFNNIKKIDSAKENNVVNLYEKKTIEEKPSKEENKQSIEMIKGVKNNESSIENENDDYIDSAENVSSDIGVEKSKEKEVENDSKEIESDDVDLKFNKFDFILKEEDNTDLNNKGFVYDLSSCDNLDSKEKEVCLFRLLLNNAINKDDRDICSQNINQVFKAQCFEIFDKTSL